MRPETRKAMELLYEAKINLPAAAASCNLTNKECKIVFNEYCNFHPPTYEPVSQVSMDKSAAD
jgi:hypothetical protein